MKKLIILVLMVVSWMCVAGPSDKLIDALVKVESNGRTNVIGDNGRAVGCLQIHKVVIDDVNAHYGTKYTYSDRTNKAKSREICKKYLIMYGGMHASDEHYARIWNGGPKGHKKSATRGYWSKVKSRMS